MFKFIHCADLHIGSGFSGLSRFDKDLVSSLAHAPADTFSAIVSLALSEEVNLVVIAGDVFDSSDVSWLDRQKFCADLERLNRADIPVIICAGNHDPNPKAWPKAMELPPNTHLLPADHGEFYPINYNGPLTIQAGGISHSTVATTEDLTPEIALALREKCDFTIGILHSNVDKSQEVANYAPTTVEALRKIPVNYWALGHVHGFCQLESTPLIAYSGIPQGRSTHEPGARGVILAQVDDHAKVTAKFCEVNSFRFETLELKDLSKISTINELLKQSSQQAKELALPSEIKGILRVVWSGVSPLHGELKRQTPGEWRDILAVTLNTTQWKLESLIINTRPVTKNDGGVAQEVALALEEFNGDSGMEKLYQELRNLRRGLPEFSVEELHKLSQEAAEQLCDYLTGEIEI